MPYMFPTKRRGPAAPPAQKLNLNALISEAATSYGVPEALLKAVIWAESGGRQDVVSPKGAIGYGQLMPGTAAQYGADPRDPIDNVATTAQHLGRLLKKYGNSKLALAAYNAGEGVVDRTGGVPNYQETINYIKRVASLLAPPPPTESPPIGRTLAGAFGYPVGKPVEQFPRAYVDQRTKDDLEQMSGLGGISDAQMSDVLAQIAQERTGSPLDLSRAYQER